MIVSRRVQIDYIKSKPNYLCILLLKYPTQPWSYYHLNNNPNMPMKFRTDQFYSRWWYSFREDYRLALLSWKDIKSGLYTLDFCSLSTHLFLYNRITFEKEYTQDLERKIKIVFNVCKTNKDVISVIKRYLSAS
jgi:hypothetical protein